MTTDPFIEAARAEAERRTPLGGHTAPALTQERAGLVAMAEWARTHLAAQPRPLMHETPPAITLSRIRQLTYNAKRRNETIRPDQILAILEQRKA